MLIDLENPDDHLYRSLDVLVTQAKRSSGTKSDVTRLWRRPGGINLRKRADRAEVETLLTRRRPELLVLGPLYKSYRVKDRDAWDLVASEVQEVLDDWRVRFSLSILIEDHAPKGKDLVPFGSSLWLRWPEIGLGLDLQKDHSLEVQRWRGDRMPTDWPDSLERGSPWPWNGRWATGTLNGEMEF
jgi:replicative DNA helicase